MTQGGQAELAVAGGMVGLFPFPAPGAARAALLDWAPQIVLTLTPSEEMARLGGADLPDALAARGIGWLHVPVADYATPDEGTGWIAALAQVRAVLATGGRVAIHCRAGCGRTGMAALRLMVDSGEPGPQALARLRATRPCAVETDAQYDWATGG